MQLTIAGIEPNSLVNGPGLRYVLFTQGCIHHCKGCHNDHTWSFNGGNTMSVDDIIKDIESNMPLIKGVTLSGGDPMEQPEAIYELCCKIKYKLALNIWLYTGYTYEELIAENNEYRIKILELVDTLVDGKFEENNTEGANMYTGSANQKIIQFFTADNILTHMTGGNLK